MVPQQLQKSQLQNLTHKLPPPVHYNINFNTFFSGLGMILVIPRFSLLHPLRDPPQSTSISGLLFTYTLSHFLLLFNSYVCVSCYNTVLAPFRIIQSNQKIKFSPQSATALFSPLHGKRRQKVCK